VSTPTAGRVLEGSAGPDGRDHLDSDACWCEPELLQPCPECLDEPPPLPAHAFGIEGGPAPIFGDESGGCWKCGGRGLVDEYDPLVPLIVAHRYPEASA